MRILIIGSGGREHAIGHILSQSGRRTQLFFAPGNAGTELLGTNLPVDVADVDALRRLARETEIDLTVVGPEVPLVHGVVDVFEAERRLIVGPTAAAARLEGSKAFAKAFMDRNNIPTAAHRTFPRSQYEEARRFVAEQGAPVVIKASGLAAGKGAIVCRSEAEALEALENIMREDAFGGAGDEVVVEEFMEGEEASLFVLTDGRGYRTLLPAQDHKRIGEGDTGPNTGGMGAYAPARLVDDALMRLVERNIVEPTLEGMQREGHPYRGVLYVGLMIADSEARVVEYNCRFGDPEAQVVLPMLQDDALDLIEAVARRELTSGPVRSRAGAAATVVLASGGYPGPYETGHEIRGLEAASAVEGVAVFHAGTRRAGDGRILTSGGRVLSVTATGPTLGRAIERAYAAADLIDFEGKYLRRDIGLKGMAHLA